MNKSITHRIKWWYVGLGLALLLALASPLASSAPDGLERVADDVGFLDRAREAFFRVLPDYSIPGVRSSALSTVLAGVVGVLVVFVIGFGLARLLRKKNET